MPLIYGEDSPTARPLSRFTWVALVSEAVLVVFWLFMVIVFSYDPGSVDTPDWASGYTFLGGLFFGFIAAVITLVLAVVGGVRGRRPRGQKKNTLGRVAIVAACLLNPIVVTPALLAVTGT